MCVGGGDRREKGPAHCPRAHTATRLGSGFRARPRPAQPLPRRSTARHSVEAGGPSRLQTGHVTGFFPRVSSRVQWPPQSRHGPRSSWPWATRKASAAELFASGATPASSSLSAGGALDREGSSRGTAPAPLGVSACRSSADESSAEEEPKSFWTVSRNVTSQLLIGRGRYRSLRERRERANPDELDQSVAGTGLQRGADNRPSRLPAVRHLVGRAALPAAAVMNRPESDGGSGVPRLRCSRVAGFSLVR